MDIQTLPIQYSSQLQAVQQPRTDMRSGSINLDVLLERTSRSMRIIPGAKHSDSGFYAISEQVGDRSSDSEVIDSMRRKLVYADGEPFGEARVAMVLKRPIVVIDYDASGEVTKASCCVLGNEAGSFVQELYFNGDELSQNLVRSQMNWRQEDIDSLSQYVENLRAVTVSDFVTQLLRRPTTIALVRNLNGHFDAAPHGNLPQERSVLELLRKVPMFRAAGPKVVSDLQRAAEGPRGMIEHSTSTE
jgi:hypothetical protein